jgi:hypothetical protein
MATARVGSARERWQRLFVIERSKNANVVVYDVHLDDDGYLDAKEPLTAYWILNAEGGGRAKLNWFQWKYAYGFTVLGKPTRDGLRFHMVAVPKRVIVVRRADGAYRAELTVAGRPCELVSFYVHTRETGVVPTVLYVDIHGKDLASGRPVVERATP